MQSVRDKHVYVTENRNQETQHRGERGNNDVMPYGAIDQHFCDIAGRDKPRGQPWRGTGEWEAC